MKIVFVHGRAQEGKDPAELQEEWKAALTEGLGKAGLPWPDGVSTALPFYGDALADLVKELEAPLVVEARARGVEAENADVRLRSDLLDELRLGLNIPDREVTACYQGSAQERGPQNWEWVHAILAVLDRTPLGSLAIDLITRDVSVYLSHRGVRSRIDALVARALDDEPLVVVGHSLGSIVGYNVLGATRRNVLRYVTVGSPLGIRAVKLHLAPPLAMPPTSGSWHNAMDERDVVALHPLDADNFSITPLITNKTDVDNTTANRHGIKGYLSDPDVARWIVEPFLGAG